MFASARISIGFLFYGGNYLVVLEMLQSFLFCS